MPASARCTTPIALLGLAVLLAGCGGLDGIGGSLISGGGQSTAATAGDEFLVRPTCPPAEIRHGTQTMPIYDPGKSGDPQSLRFQISVQRVARECDLVGGNMVVRVGTAGRVAAGPKGATGTVQVPVRVAVVGRDDQVIYSKLHVVSVDVRAPDFSALWTQVDDAVTVPADATSGSTIYVGLDETGGKPAPRARKR